MKDIKEEFFKYVEKFDDENPRMHRKIWHSVRVAENSKKIAESLSLSEEEINIAEVIGLLHDVGKLEQINDEKYKEIEHGKLAVEILKKDDYISKYVETDRYNEIIFKAIENHGLFKIEEGLTEKELMFAKIIRDADKLDIFYEELEMFWNTEEKIESANNAAEISPAYLKQFKENKPICRDEDGSKFDELINVLSFVFDINYKYDFTVLKEEDYINKILNKFNFVNERVKEQIEEIRAIANEYIAKRIDE